jgi:hypothetical protein
MEKLISGLLKSALNEIYNSPPIAVANRARLYEKPALRLKARCEEWLSRAKPEELRAIQIQPAVHRGPSRRP